MFIKYLIPYCIKQALVRLIIKRKNTQIKIGRNCQLDIKTICEGHNAIQDNVRLYSSFLGRGSYIANGSMISGTKIGRFCSIGGNVRTGLGMHPTKDFVSISPSFYSLNTQTGLNFSKKQLFEEHLYIDQEKKYFCEIGNDVWIGNNVMIMDGVTIGDGAIIAGGAVVTQDIEPYSIVGGLPAKFIKNRFHEDEIQKLLSIKWWNWSLDELKNKSVQFTDIKKFIKNN